MGELPCLHVEGLTLLGGVEILWLHPFQGDGGQGDTGHAKRATGSQNTSHLPGLEPRTFF